MSNKAVTAYFKRIGDSTQYLTKNRVYELMPQHDCCIANNVGNPTNIARAVVEGMVPSSTAWEAVPLNSEGGHHMVGIIFPSTSHRTYHYRTTVDFDIGEEVEFRRGRFIHMVRISDVCPARVDKHFRHKWLTFNKEDCLYEVEV